MGCVMVTRLLCIHHCCGTSPSAGKWEKQCPRGTGAVGEEVPDCRQQLCPSVALGTHPDDPGAVPQLCHVLDPSLRGHQLIQRRCSLLLRVPGREKSSWERVRMRPWRASLAQELGETKIPERGEATNSPAQPAMHGDVGQLPCRERLYYLTCYFPTIPWQGERYPLPGDGLKSKHGLGGPQETQLSPDSCALACSLTTSVQLCHPKHGTQTLPLPGGFFPLLCLWRPGPEGINTRAPKTHELLTVQALYPSRADCNSFFST